MALSKLRSLMQRSTARNTSWMLAGHVARLCLQTIYFVIVARSLGVSEFGKFAAVAALVNIVLPFAPLGSGVMMVRDVARDRSLFAQAWGSTLGAIMVLGACLALLVTVATTAVLPGSISLMLIAAVAAADLIFYNLTNAAGQAFQSVQRLERTALIAVVLSIARCLAALGFLIAGSRGGAAGWALWYLGATVCAGIWACLYATRKLGRPHLSISRPLRRAREGAYFAVSLMTFTVYTDIDKTMLARLGSLDAAGIYTAGYRVVTFATMPIMALVSATFPEFFVRGAGGVRSARAYAWRLMKFTLAYSAVASLALVALSPLASVVLGDGYAPSEFVIRSLSVVVVAQAAHLLLANVLTGADHQGVRTVIQVGIALLNIVLNLWLIPLYEINAAIVTTLISEVGLVAVLTFTIAVLMRRESIARRDVGV